MSKRRRQQRAMHQAKEEKEGRKVVNWIFGVLVAAAVCYLIYWIITMS